LSVKDAPGAHGVEGLMGTNEAVPNDINRKLTYVKNMLA
jgi:hypothetical protein